LPNRHPRSCMFARRKHRPQEEDEPLVPHGLIWQATDDEPEESPDPAALVTPQVQAEPTEMPLRTDNRTPENEAAPTPAPSVQEPIARPVDPNPSKLGAISPPIRWPSLKTASVIRRVEPPPVPIRPIVTDSKPAPEASVPQKLTLPAQVAAQTKPQPGLERSALKPVAESNIRQVEVIELETKDGSQAERSPRREAFVRMVGSLRLRVRSVYGVTVKSAGHAGRKLQSAYASINLRARFEHAKPVAQRCLRGLKAGAVSARQALKSLWASNTPQMARVKSSVGEFSSNAMKSSIARSADLAQRLRTHRIRIRIVRSARAQALIQRGKLAWATRTAVARREPRLWTSLAMAALSALLTLGLISAVRPYSPGRNSSNKTSRSEQSPIQPASLIAPQTALASTRRTVRPSRNNTAAQTPTPTKPSPVATTSKPKQATSRVHHNDDEDYVAPNSYHYYGSSGKSR
jgi:hypothetical protein